MKRAFVLLATVLCYINCSKETISASKTALFGTWELRVSDGGLIYAHTVYSAGNGNNITFSGNNQFTKTISSGNVRDTFTGTYSIIKGSTCVDKDVTFIQFLPDSAAYLFSVSKNTLHINPNNCIMADVPDLEYTKIK